MDVDNEIDQNLLQQFSCLGTTDRDVLITQLQKLVGNQLSNTGCAFFLDMNNWNLQAAVCSYYDLESPKDRLPTMSFVRDVTVGEGESVPPSTKFVKTWKLQNCGEEQWPPGCSLRYTQGDCLSTQDRIMVEPLKAYEVADVSLEMCSPDKAGIYQGQWRMFTATGTPFGDVIWMIITVAEGGILGLTQQMSQLNELGTSQQTENSNQSCNPFAYNNPKFDGIAIQQQFNSVRMGMTDTLLIQEIDSNCTSNSDEMIHQNNVLSLRIFSGLKYGCDRKRRSDKDTLAYVPRTCTKGRIQFHFKIYTKVSEAIAVRRFGKTLFGVSEALVVLAAVVPKDMCCSINNSNCRILDNGQ
uniref:Nbr1 FW domain-containing protein n=1 Tax=Strigamia maritima TaxID=126957 RepID=T1IRJ1_STRMM